MSVSGADHEAAAEIVFGSRLERGTSPDEAGPDALPLAKRPSSVKPPARLGKRSAPGGIYNSPGEVTSIDARLAPHTREYQQMLLRDAGRFRFATV